MISRRSGILVVLALTLSVVMFAWAIERGWRTGPASAGENLAYVNLGDSFSSGSGIEPLAFGFPRRCNQSGLNWAHTLAARRGLSLSDVSCSGAQTKDLVTSQFPGLPPQLDALAPNTKLITITVGGNDGDVFAQVMSVCRAAAVSTNGIGNPCERANAARFIDRINQVTYPAMVGALREIRTRAPAARVAIASYLQILPSTQGCYPIMPIAAGDVPYVNGIFEALNAASARAASEVDAIYLDNSVTSVGHDACQPRGVRWVEPTNDAINADSAHPNSAGQAAMAARAIEVLGL